jgi:pimeloyl-ACP methyl ester carboxylesterase
VSASIERFEIRVDDAVLADLQDRLARTRYPDQIDGTGWEYGMPISYLRELVEHWQHAYDWRAQETRLNELEHFRTTIDGQSIHFIHQRSAKADAFPVLLMHGWPGSVVEFLDVIPRLTDELHLVVPSLPGYGFSEPTRSTGWDVVRIARAFMDLMARLGYERYGAQGGDWGAQVATRIGALDTDHCAAIHTNMPLAQAPDPPVELSAQDKADLGVIQQFRAQESAYSFLQATKPQTVGAALNDSPAGLLAWVVEKFHAWSDCDGHPEHAFTRDQLLTNAMTYWVTETITSSMRLYWERQRAEASAPPAYVPVPTGVARFPKEILKFPRSWVERSYHLTHWTDMPRGGHFAAMEQPDLFADDVKAFFQTVA